MVSKDRPASELRTNGHTCGGQDRIPYLWLSLAGYTELIAKTDEERYRWWLLQLQEMRIVSVRSVRMQRAEKVC